MPMEPVDIPIVVPLESVAVPTKCRLQPPSPSLSAYWALSTGWHWRTPAAPSDNDGEGQNHRNMPYTH